MATTAPAISRSAVADRASSPGRGRRWASQSTSRGPQSGQQTGWAWKRRSKGSWYSAAQAGHDGEAGPAVRAVGEGVPVAAVGRVVHLGPALGAGGRVR